MKNFYIVILLSLWQFSVTAQTYSGGSGTSIDPFLISTKSDLKYLSENSSEWLFSYLQTADLNFISSDFASGGDFYNGGEGFLSIGIAPLPFEGSYDGGNFVIDGLKITSSSSEVGLFGLTLGSSLSNIHLTNSAVTGVNSVGKLAGNYFGSIVNCHAEGSVTGNNDVGGLVGIYGTGSGIIGCSSSGALNGHANLGGLVGSNYSTIENSFSAGTVTGTIDPTSVNIGGLIGLCSGSTVIEGCYSSASLYGNTNVGGLVGNINDNCDIDNCYATGNLVGGYYIGGFIGRFFTGDLNVTNSYCIGNVNGVADKGSFGGHISNGTYTNCYWNSETSGLTTSGGGGAIAGVQSKTTSQLKTQSTFTNWDFIIETTNGIQDIWKMNACTNDGYPLLSWGIPLVLDDASFSFDQPSYCYTSPFPTPTITGVAGGTFSSTAGLIIDPSTGEINPFTSTTGAYSVTYTTNTSCSSSFSVPVEITTADDVSFSYPSTLCSDQNSIAPIITGVTFGIFNNTTSGLTINTSTGVIDATTSTPGNHIVQYFTSSGCSNSSAINITINSVDNANYSYSATAFCANEEAIVPTITGLTGGTFSSTSGLTINSSTGIIDASTSTVNSYSVTYTTTGTCPSSEIVDIEIVDLPNVTTSVSGLTISATLAGASYKWLDCNDNNSVIPGETSQTFTATTNGNYAVIVDNGNCVDTSACVAISTVGITDLMIENLNIYPNPANDYITIQYDGEINTVELIDMTGRIIAIDYSEYNKTISLRDIEPGKYLLKVTVENKRELLRSIVRLK